MSKLTEEYVRRRIGSPEEIAARHKRLSKSAELLSANIPDLIEQYEGKWIAVVDGQVRAAAPTFAALQKLVTQERFGADGQMIVRRIARHRRTLIL
jgi:hypothetical protein